MNANKHLFKALLSVLRSKTNVVQNRNLLVTCKKQSIVDVTHASIATDSPIRIAVIGSGPSGFYISQQLVKHPRVVVDMYEKFPVPFGLVRFGVAPDHQSVKNVINSFTNTALNKKVSFMGNVAIGTDISLQDIRNQYNAVILCYGAAQDKTLNIEGENLPNVISARRFVGWYNGVPYDKNLEIDLSCDTAVIIGHGNVAIDCARILLTDCRHILSNTDITKHSLERLKESRIKNVYIVGRRGPMQVSFTIKEFREMTRLPDCRTIISADDCAPISDSFIESLERPKRRLTELIVRISKEKPNEANIQKRCFVKFMRSPRFIRGNNSDGISEVVFAVNRFETEDLFYNSKGEVVPTQTLETIKCGLVLRSIGYKAIPIDPSLPIDHKTGTIMNQSGRVVGCGTGLYCSGWAATGAHGVILNTMNASIEVAKNVLKDIEDSKLDLTKKSGNKPILEKLESKGIKVIYFNDWKLIDRMEQQLGSTLGKPREKIVDIDSMIAIVKKNKEV